MISFRFQSTSLTLCQRCRRLDGCNKPGCSSAIIVFACFVLTTSADLDCWWIHATSLPCLRLSVVLFAVWWGHCCLASGLKSASNADELAAHKTLSNGLDPETLSVHLALRVSWYDSSSYWYCCLWCCSPIWCPCQRSWALLDTHSCPSSCPKTLMSLTIDQQGRPRQFCWLRRYLSLCTIACFDSQISWGSPPSPCPSLLFPASTRACISLQSWRRSSDCLAAWAVRAGARTSPCRLCQTLDPWLSSTRVPCVGLSGRLADSDCYVGLSALPPDFCALREFDSARPCRLRLCPNRHHHRLRRPRPARRCHSLRVPPDAVCSFRSTASCLCSNTTCLQRLLYLRWRRRCFRSCAFHLALLAQIFRPGAAQSGTDALAGWTEVSARSSSSTSVVAFADFGTAPHFAGAAGLGPAGCRHSSTVATSTRTSS